MKRFDVWHDDGMTGVRVGNYQVDFRRGRDPWVPLFVRYGERANFGNILDLRPIGVITYGRRRKPVARIEDFA